MKYIFGIGLLTLLSGCNVYIDNPDKLIEKLQKCNSVGMTAEIISQTSETLKDDVKVNCKDKLK